MAKYIIDTEAGTCEPYIANTPPESPVGQKLLDLMKPFIGTKEYDGVVSDIQRWYYGTLIKAPWCATCLSYFLNKAGVDIKDENVYGLFLKAQASGRGSIIKNPESLKKGDIVFILYSSNMSTTASKHVTVCVDDTAVSSSGSFMGRGGNQDDSLCDKVFACKNIYAVWRV